MQFLTKLSVRNGNLLQCPADDNHHFNQHTSSASFAENPELNSLNSKLKSDSYSLIWIVVVSFSLLLIFELAEIFYNYRQTDRIAQKESESNQIKSPKYYAQMICHILLAIIFPIAWIIARWRSADAQESFIHHLLRCTFHLLSWSLAFFLAYKTPEQQWTKLSILRRGSVLLLVCFVAGFDRCLWWANNETVSTCKLVIFTLEIVAIIATVSLLLDQHALSWQLLSEQKDEINDDEKPPRSLRTKFALILPYIWPKDEKTIQLQVSGCIAIMLLQRAIIVYMPLNNKKIVDSLTYRNSSTNKFDFRWDLIVFYAVLEFLNYNILYPVRRKLWAGVEQFTSREAQVKLYEHLLNLSLRFHVERKTGEVLKIMDRGISCVTGLVGNVLFYSFPELVDILFSAIFFTSTYDYRFVSITFVTMILYTAFSLLSTKWQKSQMEERIAADDDFSAMGVDSLLNFETVKYYNAEDYETRRYRTALEKSQTTELSQSTMYDLIYGVESIITGSGQLAGSLLCAYLIAQENGLTVGDYFLFATYISQLTSPLTVLEKIYREITESLVEMDKMFDIMEEKPEVCDHPDAVDYVSNAGKIELKSVTFGYTKDQPVLKDVSFSVPPGKTFAFVGPSGSGKSTIIRLLFRFYDPDSGQILYDGQDITKVKQKSLRRHLGVVPQDTVLFNDTVSYNIRYGRVDASEEEMIEAAKAADIHKTIIGFTDGYDAKVGERGLKLSGGEKQRVAIARTILKSPSFVFLDEATSSLDTHTERNIHASLQQACRGKTTVVIAHRLSTIIGADEIIVLKEGRIAESGSHNELLAKEGIYFSMWMQQLTSEQLVTSEATLMEST